MMYRGDLSTEKLTNYLHSTLKHCYIEFSIEQWLHLLYLEKNNCFKVKFCIKDFIKGMENISELENVPISIDRLNIGFKFCQRENLSEKNNTTRGGMNI
jgi:hypothetical protein